MQRRAFLKLAGQAAAALGAAAWLPTPPARAATPGAAALHVSEQLLVHDRAGRRFRLDPFGHRVARLDAAGRELWAWGGNPLDGPNHPVDLVEDSRGRLLLLDQGNSTVHGLSAEGERLWAWSTPEMREALVPAMALDAADRLYLCQPMLHRVLVLSPEGRLILRFGEPGAGAGQLNAPSDLAFDSHGDLHVLDTGNRRVQVFSPEGRPLRAYAPQAGLQLPCALLAQGSSLYVADAVGTVYEFTAAGRPLGARALTFPDGRSAAPIRLTPLPDEGLAVFARAGHPSQALC